MTVRNVNGTWRVDVKVAGRRWRGATDATSRREAMATEKTIRGRLAAGEPPADIKVRVKKEPDAPESWTLRKAVDKAKRGWSHHRSYQSYHVPMTRSLIRLLGDHTEFASIKADSLRELRDQIVGDKIKPATWNRYMQVLNSIIVLCRDEWDKPWPNVKPLSLRLRESERFRILYAGEEERLIEAAGRIVGPAYQDFVAISLDTGWRLSEGLRLTADSVDTVGRTVTLWDTKHGSRTLPLTRRATAAMERQKPDVGRVFPWAKERNWAYWKRTREAAGIDDKTLTFHCLRHTCATRLLESGRDIHVVSRWLGHADLETTQRYAKVLPGMLAEARDALEAES